MKQMKKVAVIILALVMVVGVFTACDLKITPEQKLMGAWRDSTGTVGYEFKEGNICTITYADFTIPVLNIKYNGNLAGTYSVSKRDDGNYYVTITYTVLSKSITSDYMFVVDGSTLTLTDVNDNESRVYMAYSAEATVPNTTSGATIATAG
ncbi:MAG: hypothetical protein PUB43_09330 [Oscillospiraceae bacterium]|nr:hypothetical protein [Oscillospiraceae bacterium]